mmetsp:Transcript_45313/g.83827  ORF Transcript_45313/g.83827 Transcript_45313/m.83827 type:complete len:112 (-) Transcript_45313:37-372(-)
MWRTSKNTKGEAASESRSCSSAKGHTNGTSITKRADGRDALLKIGHPFSNVPDSFTVFRSVLMKQRMRLSKHGMTRQASTMMESCTGNNLSFVQVYIPVTSGLVLENTRHA